MTRMGHNQDRHSSATENVLDQRQFAISVVLWRIVPRELAEILRHQVLGLALNNRPSPTLP